MCKRGRNWDIAVNLVWVGCTVGLVYAIIRLYNMLVICSRGSKSLILYRSYGRVGAFIFARCATGMGET